MSRRAASLLEHPTAALLLIEVADSSIRKDRKIKVPIYAEAGVPEYWIVDVNAAIVEIHSRPDHGIYTSVVRVDRTGVLRPIELAGIEIQVAELPWP